MFKLASLFIAFLPLVFTAPALDLNARADPSGVFYVTPNGDTTKCMGVVGGVHANGALVDIYDCNESATQQWQFMGNNLSLVTVDPVTLTPWCLDAGNLDEVANGVQMKIWQCYFNELPQQMWFSASYFPGIPNAIVLDTPVTLDGEWCLDLTNGVKTNRNILQIWECTNSDLNQNWVFVPAGPSTSSDVVTITSTTSVVQSTTPIITSASSKSTTITTTVAPATAIST